MSTRYCKFEECRKTPNFNKIGETQGLYCKMHKKEEMVNVKSKTCVNDGCRKQPIYNKIGETQPLYCAQHKEIEMVNVKQTKKCQVKNCKNDPQYNFEGKRAILCVDHKQENMINIAASQKCFKCDNESIAKYKDGNGYCVDHYPETKKVNTYKKNCKYCMNCESDYICDDCKSRRHLKEYDVVTYLKKNIYKECMTDTNKPVDECSKRRPDVYYDCFTHVVIVEIDEDQHRRYDSSCECARLSEIMSSIAGKPGIIIRYNPDKIMNKNEEITVSKKKRLKYLKKIVKRELNHEPETYKIKLIQLYYDGNDESYKNYQEEDITQIVDPLYKSPKQISK